MSHVGYMLTFIIYVTLTLTYQYMCVEVLGQQSVVDEVISHVIFLYIPTWQVLGIYDTFNGLNNQLDPDFADYKARDRHVRLCESVIWGSAAKHLAMDSKESISHHLDFMFALKSIGVVRCIALANP